MFGYLNIEREKLTDGERGLWQTFMCGLCMSTKKLFSNKSRLVVNNDINFFNVLFHSFMQIDVEIEHKTCIAHPFSKRTILKNNDMLDKLAIANIILTNFNLLDDVLDGNSLKHKLAHKAFQKDYRKAQAKWAEMDSMVELYYQQLRDMEKSGCQNLDKICHPFAELTRQFAKLTLEQHFNDIVGDLCYNVGKWIYLIDALDDIKHDLSKGDYNAFVDYYKLQKASGKTLEKCEQLADSTDSNQSEVEKCEQLADSNQSVLQKCEQNTDSTDSNQSVLEKCEQNIDTLNSDQSEVEKVKQLADSTDSNQSVLEKCEQLVDISDSNQSADKTVCISSKFDNSKNVPTANSPTDKKEEIQFVMFAVLNRIAMCFNDLNLTKYRCILQNVIYNAMRNKTQQTLNKYTTV